MLLAGGQGSRLYVLTENMAKPAVPFGGKFRIIDFPFPTARTPASTPSACSRSTARWSSTATSATASPGTLTARTAASHPPALPEREGRDVVQGHGERHLPEHRLRGYVRSRLCAHSLRRPHLQDGLRRHARAPQACARRLHHRRDGGALGRGEPLRHHERRRRGHHHGV